MKVPFVDLSRQYRDLKSQLIKSITDTCDSGQFILGEANEKLEIKLSEVTSSRYAITVGNGTDALMIAMRLLDIGSADEVIVPVNSFIASAGAVAAIGATPIFADVGYDHNIDPGSIEPLITNKTRAIIVVHLSGVPTRMDEIRDIADKFNLFIIEDAAQAIGSEYKGQRVGSLGDVATFSLHPLKNLSVIGDGGFISLSCPHLYKRALRLRNHGLLNRDTAAEWGYNSRLDELQARVCLKKLEFFDDMKMALMQKAQNYTIPLSRFVDTPVVDPNCAPVLHNYMILSDRRDELMNYLALNGVETKIHYPTLLCDQPAFSKLGCSLDGFPMARDLNRRKLSLPLFAELEDFEQDFVITKISAFFGSS